MGEHPLLAGVSHTCGTRMADAVGFPTVVRSTVSAFILIGRGLVCLLEHIRNAEDDVLLQGEGMLTIPQTLWMD
eukprot:7384883-Prymnesium_polylepis.1